MAWDIRNLIRPVAPGMSGALNPLTFIGSGMATGDIGGSLSRMGELQQAGQRLSMQQAESQAAMAQAAAEAERAAKMQALAPGMAREMFPDNPKMQAMLAANPALLQQAMTQRMQPAKQTSLQQNLSWAMSLPEGDPRREAAIQAVTKPGTTVNVGGEPKFGSVPTGQARVEDPESATGTRLVDEPGFRRSDTAMRARAIAGEQQDLIALFMEGLKDESGNLSTQKLAQARAPGSSLNNLLGRISQNEVYLKSGAAASLGEQIKTEASIQPSVAQIMAGSEAEILGQLERSAGFAGRFLGEEPEEEKDELPPMPPGWSIKKVGN